MRNRVAIGKVEFTMFALTWWLGSAFLFFSQVGFSQNIIEAEYFIDTDPGFGSATPVSVSAGTTIDINFNAATSALPSGGHVLYMRTKDENGVWGFTEARPFYINQPGQVSTPPPADIDKMEYFLDTDPGHGAATNYPVSSGASFDVNAVFSTSSLPEGFHIVGVRTRNTDGNWGFVEYRPVYVRSSSSVGPPTVYDVTEMEYYFDTDPGPGSATPWPAFAQGQSIDLNELISESGALSSGLHTLVIRAKNENGEWGFYEKRPVVIKGPSISSPTIPNIAKIEYFFDGNDPGIGNATDLPISPAPSIDLDPAIIPTSPTLIDGQHTITVRAMNADNEWGMAETTTFDVLDDCTQPIADFTPQLACASQVVTFVDNSTDLQPDAQYRWYLNGDDVVDDTTVGDATFTYNFSGTYVVALAIRQGTICLDSIATTIEIQPLPVAVFSASGTVVNQPTTFTASAINLPVTPIWEWDFDGDAIIDDTTEGNTSFTYTSTGSYDASLTISDGVGCSVSVVHRIDITGSGGSATPTTDFLPENGCVGSSIDFIDISQNIPGSATYSWDFDGDGNEDSTVPGSQSYTFASSGTFNAQLIIDLGGSTIQASHTVEIVEIPVASFSAPSVCETTAMSFTDMSSGVDPSAVYMWDFDNDGIIDSNAKTGVNYSYPSSGSYIVSLIISNGHGCTDEIVKQVTVVNLPSPDFEWSGACTNETVAFNNISTDALAGAVYSWDLDGDGLEDFSNNGDVSFAYPSNGSYNGALTISNLAGCEATITKTIDVYDRPDVIIDIIAKCYGQESQMMDLSQLVGAGATYSWDFDNDGNVDDATVGSTAYTYSTYNSYVVSLTIDNGGGCSASAEELVVFSDAATPDFTVNKTCQGEEVVFTDLSSDLNTGALYSWDFDGDDLEDSAFPGSTAFTYNQSGVYNATLTIDNGDQCLAFKTIALDVTPPPAVDLGPDVELCAEGEVVLDAGTGYSAYLWPDGSNNQTYTVDVVGNYVVRVQDAKGCFNKDTVAVKLLGAPVPSFSYSIELSLEGIGIAFTNTTSNADTYSWSFGDGTTSLDMNPSHIYSDFSFYTNSVYEVCLTAANSCEEAEYCESILVSPTDFSHEDFEAMNVYPNPVEQLLYIELNEQLNDKMWFGLVDATGKLYWNPTTNEKAFQINVGKLAQGTYYLIWKRNNEILYRKILKQ